MNKLRLIIFVLIVICNSCREDFKKECQVTGAYEIFSCPEEYSLVDDILFHVGRYSYAESCTKVKVDSACILIYNKSEQIFALAEQYNNSNFDSLFWQSNSRYIISLNSRSDYGSKVYSSIFVAENEDEKELLICCQYEMKDQCAGSTITSLPINYLISLPIHYADYKFKFKIKNVNPL